MFWPLQESWQRERPSSVRRGLRRFGGRCRTRARPGACASAEKRRPMLSTAVAICFWWSSNGKRERAAQRTTTEKEKEKKRRQQTEKGVSPRQRRVDPRGVPWLRTAARGPAERALVAAPKRRRPGRRGARQFHSAGRELMSWSAISCRRSSLGQVHGALDVRNSAQTLHGLARTSIQLLPCWVGRFVDRCLHPLSIAEALTYLLAATPKALQPVPGWA